MDNFQPVRKVIISSEDFQLPAEVAKGDKFSFTLKLENPYPYDLVVDNRDLSLDIVWTKRKQITHMFALTDSFTLPANGSIDVECDFEIPDSINSQSYNVGFALHNRKMFTWFNSPIGYTELK